MATPISMTIGEVFSYSNFKSCAGVYAFANANYPGWTESTVIDVLEWTEGLRALGQPVNASYGIYQGLSDGQKNAFISWSLAQLLANAPENWNRQAALSSLEADINSFIASPTEQLSESIAASASDIIPTSEEPEEIYIANAFKGIANALVNSAISADVLRELARCISRAANRIKNVDLLEVNGTILTKLQQIIGVRD